jgi:hypothetical protein
MITAHITSLLHSTLVTYTRRRMYIINTSDGTASSAKHANASGPPRHGAGGGRRGRPFPGVSASRLAPSTERACSSMLSVSDSMEARTAGGSARRARLQLSCWRQLVSSTVWMSSSNASAAGGGPSRWRRRAGRSPTKGRKYRRPAPTPSHSSSLPAQWTQMLYFLPHGVVVLYL